MKKKFILGDRVIIQEWGPWVNVPGEIVHVYSGKNAGYSVDVGGPWTFRMFDRDLSKQEKS